MVSIALAVKSVKDIISHANKTGEVRAPQDLKEKRLAVCNECKFFNGSRCEKCGCFMGIKASLIATSCPLGIWDAKMVEEIAMGDMYYNTIDNYLYGENCCER